jgi:hypothetical protein
MTSCLQILMALVSFIIEVNPIFCDASGFGFSKLTVAGYCISILETGAVAG